MLVVSRKKHELIQIGDDVVIKIIKTGRNSVKIGIDAPGGTRVLRGEMCLEDLEESLPTILSKNRTGQAVDSEILRPCGAL